MGGTSIHALQPRGYNPSNHPTNQFRYAYHSIVEILSDGFHSIRSPWWWVGGSWRAGNGNGALSDIKEEAVNLEGDRLFRV